MTATKPEPFVITDDTTRAELAECLTNLCRCATAISRKGRAFQINSAEYARHHGRINAVLEDYLRATS